MLSGSCNFGSQVKINYFYMNCANMIKQFSLFLLIITIIGIKCQCPQLKPNHNVHVSCSSVQGPGSDKLARRFKCAGLNSSSTIAINEIPSGTTAGYKCNKYFKPIFNRNKQNSGTLNCTQDGTWTNQRAFQEFYCEFDCGIQPSLKNELISGGNSTKSENWPWVATIFRQANDGQFKYSCGGTLIGQKTILTAAHCVTDEGANKLPSNRFRIFFATVSSNYQENLHHNNVQMFSVKEIDLHPDYNVQSLVADVAIIVLNETITFSETVLPICLPKSYDHDALVIGAGNAGEISSFGIDGTGEPANILQHADIPIQSSAICYEILNIIPYGDQFCGGDPKGPNICRGDSGSGLVFKSNAWNEEKYSIHGIVSSAGEVENGCAPMAVFTKVFSHISWIQEKYIAAENLEYIRQVNINSELTKGNHDSKLYTRAERRALSKIRPLVKNILLNDYMHTNKYLIRYLRAKEMNLKETKEMLEATMKWRKANRMNEILSEDFRRFRKEYPVLFQGYARDGRPVFLYLPGAWDLTKLKGSADFEKFKRYVIRNMEEAEYRIRINNAWNITESVTIADMHGITNRKHTCRACLGIWTHAYHVYESYYPQKSGLSIYINTPNFADRIIDAVLPFVSKSTADNIRVFGTNKTEWSNELLKLIPPDQLFVGYGGTKEIKEGTKLIQLTI